MLPFYLQTGLKKYRDLPDNTKRKIHSRIWAALLIGLGLSFIFYISDMVSVEIQSNNSACVGQYGEGYTHETVKAERMRDAGIEVSDEDITKGRSMGVCLKDNDVKEFKQEFKDNATD